MTSKFYKLITWKEILLVIAAITFTLLAIASVIFITALVGKLVTFFCLLCFSGVFIFSLIDSINHKRNILKMWIKDLDLSRYGVKRHFVILMDNSLRDRYIQTMKDLDKFAEKCYEEDIFYHLEKRLALEIELKPESIRFDMYEPYVIIMIKEFGTVVNDEGKLIQGFQDGNWLEISYGTEGIAPIFLHEISHLILAKYGYTGNKSHQVIAETIGKLLTK